MPTFDLGLVKGPKGDTGATGSEGPQGVPGPQGNPGVNGITPNVQVGTTETLPAGEDAEVVRREGSPDAAPVFDFKIPRGADAPTPGDMFKAIYDPQGKNQDVFAYVEEAAYVKEECLNTDVAASYGLTAGAVPLDVLSALSKALLLVSGSVKNALGNSVTIPAGSLGLKIVSGYFTANQAASRLINIGFTPDFVILMSAAGLVGHQSTFLTGGIAVTGSPCKSGSNIIFDVATNGFNVYYNTGISVFTNGYTGDFKHYIAGKYT